MPWYFSTSLRLPIRVCLPLSSSTACALVMHAFLLATALLNLENTWALCSLSGASMPLSALSAQLPCEPPLSHCTNSVPVCPPQLAFHTLLFPLTCLFFLQAFFFHYLGISQNFFPKTCQLE